MLPRRLLLPALLLALLMLPVPGASSSASAPGPSYTWSHRPSPVVLLLPDDRVKVRPFAYCWAAPSESTPDGDIGSALCVDGFEPSRRQMVKIARHGRLRFWFGRPGWTWRVGVKSFAHPRREGCALRRKVETTSGQRFVVAAPKYRGTYRVRMFGRGPEGDELLTFSWRFGAGRGRCS